jgi:hypothetical protein
MKGQVPISSFLRKNQSIVRRVRRASYLSGSNLLGSRPYFVRFPSNSPYMMHALSGVGGVIPPSGANRKSGRQTISFFFWLYARKGNCNCLRRGAISGKKGELFPVTFGHEMSRNGVSRET